MRRPPLLLTAAAVAVVALVLLPLVYLVVRAGSGGLDVWEVLGRRGTLELVVRTAALVAAVVAAAIALGVPLAWLVVRSDLPAPRLWAVVLLTKVTPGVGLVRELAMSLWGGPPCPWAASSP